MGHLKENPDLMFYQINTLKRQNERLRMVLEKIADPKMYDCPNWVKIDHIKEFAREALNAPARTDEL